MTLKPNSSSAGKAGKRIALNIERCRNSMLGGNRAQRFPEADWITTIIEDITHVGVKEEALRKTLIVLDDDVDEVVRQKAIRILRDALAGKPEEGRG